MCCSLTRTNWLLVILCLVLPPYIYADGDGHSRFGGLLEISATAVEDTPDDTARSLLPVSTFSFSPSQPGHDPLLYYYLKSQKRKSSLDPDAPQPTTSWGAVIAILAVSIALIAGLHTFIMSCVRPQNTNS